MYTEQELTDIRAQQKKRWIILMIPCLVLLAIIVYSLTIRLEWLTSAATVVMGILLIFCFEMFIRPLHRYAVHLDNCLHGRTHELDCTYQGIDADISVVEGVKYYAMSFQQQDDNGDPFERMLYWDAEKPVPALQSGEQLHIVYHDRMIAQLTRA